MNSLANPPTKVSEDGSSIREPMTCRHWLIIAAGVLIAFGPCALVYNVWSIFVVPVSSSLGVSSSQFTFFITLVYLVVGIAAPFAGNLLQKHDLRIVLSASVVMVALGLFLCSFWARTFRKPPIDKSGNGKEHQRHDSKANQNARYIEQVNTVPK